MLVLSLFVFEQALTDFSNLLANGQHKPCTGHTGQKVYTMHHHTGTSHWT